MLTGTDFYNRYGHPDSHVNILMWDVPAELEIGVIPKRIYCNADIIPHLTQGFKNLIERNCVAELKTWDGCYNYRAVRGMENKYNAAMKAGDKLLAISYLSIHSWAGAIDLNAASNGLGKTPTLSPEFVKCFTDADMDWGGNFKGKRVDGMHFQMASLPTKNSL